MSLFSRLYALWQGALSLLALLGLLLLLYALLRELQLGRWKRVPPIALLILAAFAHLQLMIMNTCWYFPLGIRLRVIPVLAFSLGTIAAAAVLLRGIRRWSASHISDLSVKEAFDRLPAGLCFYLPGGLIKLVNRSMDALCLEALGETLMDPEGFRRRLEEGSLPGSLRGGEAPVIGLPDGRVWSFRHRVLDTELREIHELLAMAVSED